MQLTKKNCNQEDFQADKLEQSILAAMNSSGIVNKRIAKEITEIVEAKTKDKELSTDEISELVFNLLISKRQRLTAKTYAGFEKVKDIQKEQMVIDEKILGIVTGNDSDARDENSNKNATLTSTQRDLIAGEYSKDLSKRLLIPAPLVQAHEDGILHFHDMDYFIQPMHNCFSRNTNFYTVSGLRSFIDFEDGAEVLVPTHTGKTQKAIVHNYGYQLLYDITFENLNNGELVVVSATADHRWLLASGGTTTFLHIGNVLRPKSLLSENYPVGTKLNAIPNAYWQVVEKRYRGMESVWCLEVEEDHSFLLEQGIVTGNCMLVNLKDMFENGTVINSRLIETPKSLQTACTIATQIILQVSNGQYGGQTISLSHLAPFVRISKNKIMKNKRKEWEDAGFHFTQEDLEKATMIDLKREIKSGVQTIQFQINTFSSSNGQAPFVSVFMYINEIPEYKEEVALLIEEVLNQRILGIKNEVGVYVTPAFPKLLYVLDEDNTYEGSKYQYLTELALQCVSKRMMPDFISAKKMKENYENQVFPPMGCVSGDEVISYQFRNKLFVGNFKDMWNRLASHFTVEQYGNGDNSSLFMNVTELKILQKGTEWVKVPRVIRNVSNTWCRILTETRELICTQDHPLPVAGRGRIEAKDIEVGNSLYVVDHIKYPCTTYVSPKKAWLYGVVVAIGRNHKGKLLIPKLPELTNTLYYEYSKNISEYPKNIADIWKLPYDKRQHPRELFKFSVEAKEAYIAGIIDVLGEVRYGQVMIRHTNRTFLGQFRNLLLSLNINVSEGCGNSLLFDVTTNVVSYLANTEMLKNICVANKQMRKSLVEEKVIGITTYHREDYSYDVTTESDYFDVSGIYSHNCRSFLSPWKDSNGEYKWYGRFNQGVVTINLVDAGLSAEGDLDKFWDILNKRLKLCKEGLLLKHQRLRNLDVDVSPIHWKYGAIARLHSHDSIEPLLMNGYSTISLGYAGLYECVLALTGQSHTTKEGEKLGLKIIQKLRDTCEQWKAETHLGFGLYGTPLESTTYKFAQCLQKRFGTIPEITDKDYITNSYHVNVKEPINPFDKLKFEAQFQKISSGGCISYIEATNLSQNIDALRILIQFIYENIQYAEINTKSDYCYVCGFDGEIALNSKGEWECPHCGNHDRNQMSVVRRTCGYLGENFWNVGRTEEIGDRYVHLDNQEYKEGDEI